MIIASIRRVLESVRADLIARQNHRDSITIERHADAVDDVYALTEREAAAGVLDAERETLREINAAIERLNDGAYGLCLDCGEGIPAKRLLAVPWASRCVGCQEAAERERAKGRAMEAEVGE